MHHARVTSHFPTPTFTLHQSAWHRTSTLVQLSRSPGTDIHTVCGDANVLRFWRFHPLRTFARKSAAAEVVEGGGARRAAASSRSLTMDMMIYIAGINHRTSCVRLVCYAGSLWDCGHDDASIGQARIRLSASQELQPWGSGLLGSPQVCHGGRIRLGTGVSVKGLRFSKIDGYKKKLVTPPQTLPD